MLFYLLLLYILFENTLLKGLHSLKPTVKGEGLSSSRSKTWITGYFDTRRRETRQGCEGSPDFSDVTLVRNDEDQGVQPPGRDTWLPTFVNMEANGEPLSQSYDSSGQELQVNGKEARITYSEVDIEGGGEKFKCDGRGKKCECRNSLRRT